jgi:hypothetical protein
MTGNQLPAVSFASAPPRRVRVLDLYRDTAQASTGTAVALARVAVAVQAPSQVFTRARAALAATRSRTPQPRTTRARGRTMTSRCCRSHALTDQHGRTSAAPAHCDARHRSAPAAGRHHSAPRSAAGCRRNRIP